MSASFSQTTIRMEKEGGVYKIPCKINGARMKMIFDSGASSVCISEAIAEYLLDNGYITNDDFIGVGSSSVADGRIVDHLRINLRDIEIEGLHLRNVEGVVMVGQKGSLLLGQSAIQELGPVTIDGDLLIIHNGSPQISDYEIDSLRSAAMHCMDSKDWYTLISLCQKLDQLGVANSFDLIELVIALQETEQYDKSGKVIERWFESFAPQSDLDIRYNMYEFYALYYQLKIRPEYDNAIKILLKMRGMASEIYGYKTTRYYFEDYYICKSLGNCYFNLKQLFSAHKYFGQAMNSYTSAKKIDVDDVEKKNFRDEKLGDIMYMYALCEEDVNLTLTMMKTAARIGSKDAQTYCIRAGVRYYR